MADNEDTPVGNATLPAGNGTDGADGAAQDLPQAGVLAQYTKDLSFENPNAPQSFQAMGDAKPQIDVNIGVNGAKLNDETYEVELKISASAKVDGKNQFVVELVYAGLFGLRNVPEDVIQPFMLVQAPTILFPFARRVIADATRDGGYPPLLLEPIDFAGLYRQQMTEQAGGGVATGAAPSDPLAG